MGTSSSRFLIATRLGKRLGLLVCALVLAMLVFLPALAVSSTPTTVFVRYTLDRSLIPPWVTHQDLTLRIEVGAAESVWTWGDGQPLPVRHDPQRGTATVTTNASELLLAARGEGLTPANIGAYSLAALKDDKLWAYSLTFDDGRLSVYQYALPELTRYGYRAAIAVIGGWLDLPNALEQGYCRAEELTQVLAAGWSLFNHSYTHGSINSISLGEALNCQEAISRHLSGYHPSVFTVPDTNAEVDRRWKPIIDSNIPLLGLQVMQFSTGWEGNPFAIVDSIMFSNATYKMGRLDIANGARPPQGYFDDAHGRATSGTPQHTWISLHGHDPNPLSSDPERVREWCSLAESTAYLYHAYGAGGTDEVWMAPADEVFQYLVVRSYVRATRSEGTPQEVGPTLEPDSLASCQQGVGGYTGWSDTYLRELFPTTSADPRDANLRLRGATGERESALLRADLQALVGATVISATLSLYATNHSNEASITLSAYPLLRPWVPAEATWLSYSQGTPWDEPGARSPSVDRSSEANDVIRVVGKCTQNQRWYVFDVTEAVRTWLAHPEQNNGLLLEGSDEVSMEVRFASSEYYDPNLRPVLRVLYRWPPPEPTPTPSPTSTSTPTATPEPTSTSTPQPGWLRGEVWEDANRDGLWDANEAPLSDVQIELRGGSELLGTRKSGANGEFTFSDLPPIAYTVTELDPPGYTSTTSNTLSVSVYPGQESRVRFGDCRLLTKAYLPLIWLPPRR